MESNPAKAWGHDTTPSLFEHPPEEGTSPVEPFALPSADDVKHTPPGPADPLPERDAMVLSTKPKVEVPKDLPTGQAIGPIKAVTQIVPITGSVVELARSVILSDQAEEER